MIQRERVFQRLCGLARERRGARCLQRNTVELGFKRRRVEPNVTRGIDLGGRAGDDEKRREVLAQVGEQHAEIRGSARVFVPQQIGKNFAGLWLARRDEKHNERVHFARVQARQRHTVTFERESAQRRDAQRVVHCHKIIRQEFELESGRSERFRNVCLLNCCIFFRDIVIM